MGELFVILLIVQIIGNVIYFFKWFKMTTREREWDRKKSRRSSSDSGSSDSFWSFDTSSSESGGGYD